MNPVVQLIALWKFIASFPYIWKLIRNYDLIKQILSDVYGVIQSAEKHGGLPTSEETIKILDAAQLIFEKQLIDIPEVDEVVLADMIKELKQNLSASVDEARKRKGLK